MAKTTSHREKCRFREILLNSSYSVLSLEHYHLDAIGRSAEHLVYEDN